MRKNGGINSDLRAGFNGGPLHAFGAQRVRIVGEHYSGRKKYVIFDCGVLAHVSVAMNAYAISQNTVVVDCCSVPDRTVVPNAIALADNYVVASLEPIS